MPVVVETFDNSQVLTNPNGMEVYQLFASHDGSYAGTPLPAFPSEPVGVARIFDPSNVDPENPVGLELEWSFNIPIPVASRVRLHNQGGGVLDDQDGINTATVDVYDNLNVLLFSGPLNAANGGAPTDTDIGLVQNVSRIVLRNIMGYPGGSAFQGRPSIWWREIEMLVPDIECAAVTDITATSATLGATGLEVSPGNFYQWEWSEFQGGPYDHKSPLISTTGADPDNITYSVTNLDPNTTYYYRVCLYDGDGFLNPNTQDVTPPEMYNVFPICSDECSFTTLDSASWCGGYFDPQDCTLVAANDDYLNCNQF